VLFITLEDNMPVQQRHESIIATRQAPLRRLYQERPEEALTRKTARTTSTNIAPTDPFHGEVEIGDGYGTVVRFGLDRYVGGLHDAPNPGDLLCAALASCADGAIRMIADRLGITLTALEVEVTGELDVRGCLLVDRDVRVGFERLSCRVRLAASDGTDRRRLDALVAAADRVCVNLDTLRSGIDVTTVAEIAS
jgi:uncharacterized OsmC-like protein